MRKIFEKILSFLRVRSVAVGLEVSGEVVRMAYFDGSAWQMHAIRLAPGIVERGIVKSREVFVASLIELKLKSGIVGQDVKKKVNAVVSVSSVKPYSKVFRLPGMQGENLEKAVDLNLQMASPGKPDEFYSDWQEVGRDVAENQVDILGAFVEREPIDSVVDALFAANFVAMAVESKSLAVARVFREKGSGIDIVKPYILVTIDNGGMEFLVIRNGHLYFEYAHQWIELENAKGEISLPAFESELTTSLRQVISYYTRQWTEPVAAIVLATVSLSSEIEKTIAETVTLPAVRLTLLMGQQISSEWLVALGCSLRGAHPIRGAREVSFLDAALEDRFRAEEMINFLGFWRVAVPASLFLLLSAFVATELFLNQTKAAVEATTGYTLPAAANMEMTNLIASSTLFDQEVSLIQSLQSNSSMNIPLIIGEIQSVAARNGVTISSLGNSGFQISMSGLAVSQEQILAFKAAMGQDKYASGVNLPITGIIQQGGNYSFSMTFTYLQGFFP